MSSVHLHLEISPVLAAANAALREHVANTTFTSVEEKDGFRLFYANVRDEDGDDIPSVQYDIEKREMFNMWGTIVIELTPLSDDKILEAALKIYHMGIEMRDLLA